MTQTMRGEARSGDLRIVALSESLLEGVVRIERESFRRPCSRDSLMCYTAPGTHHFCAALSASGEVLGYAGYVQEEGLAHVLTVACGPQCRRQGVGSTLLRFLLAEAARAHLPGAHLEVRPTNSAARRLYESLGFTYGRSLPAFYEDGQDGLVMIWRNLDLPVPELRKSKSDLRALALSRRRGLTPSERASFSKAISRTLMDRPEFRVANTVMFYLSMKDEVGTWEILDWAWGQGKKVCVPRSDLQSLRLVPTQIETLEDLAPGCFGVMEPRISTGSHPVDPGQINLVLVPGVAFDYSGGRIGFGKGLFDRFLSETRSAKIGLAFGVQMRDVVPMDRLDVRLETIITERGTYGG